MRINGNSARRSYRLPTEAEWEYAARAGTRMDTHVGDLRILGKFSAPLLNRIAWYGGNSGVTYEGGVDGSGWEQKQHPSDKCGTHPVGRKVPNSFGLHDMLGNIGEWVQDRKGRYQGGMVIDPIGPKSGAYRVSRGVSWYGIAKWYRSADRRGESPSYRGCDLGFRLLRTE